LITNEYVVPNQHLPLSELCGQFPLLFHKYQLGTTPIDLTVMASPLSDDSVLQNEFVCHLHIQNITLFDSYYPFECFQRLLAHFCILITYSNGTIPRALQDNKHVVILRIANKGYDIGGKVCALEYMKRCAMPCKYILFLHSKTRTSLRTEYFGPLISSHERILLIKTCMKYRNVIGIFPNKICTNQNYEFVYNQHYFTEWMQYLGVQVPPLDPGQMVVFPEGNCFICHISLMHAFFQNDYARIYNLMNDSESFDANWYNVYYHQNRPFHSSTIESDIQSMYQSYKQGSLAITCNHCPLYGNNTPLLHTPHSIPDGMFEHQFERGIFLMIQHLQSSYVILGNESVFDFYNIKLNAIYFPQFHEIKENNEFWGKGFTEWTLLQPYPEQYTNVHTDKTFTILKPHEDIGYYDLTDPNTLVKQIQLANDHHINGFVIYHYWFDDNTKILYKPLERFLEPSIQYPFCISWANETWSKRWDGTNREVLLKQSYGDVSSMVKHVQYLIPSFQRPNYMRTVNGEVLFYIYNLHDIGMLLFSKMKQIWEAELAKHDIRICIVNTENSNRLNHNNPHSLDEFMFEPMYSTNYMKNVNELDMATLQIRPEEFDCEYYLAENEDLSHLTLEEAFAHYQSYGYRENRAVKWKNQPLHNNYKVLYSSIIELYRSDIYEPVHKHFGLPLYWNNIVRRTNLPYLYIDDFEPEHVQTLLLIASMILKRHANMHSHFSSRMDNVIIVNAWNEWNEQAVLDPNTVTGYENLQLLKGLVERM
jgi:hypothetical protein